MTDEPKIIEGVVHRSKTKRLPLSTRILDRVIYLQGLALRVFVYIFRIIIIGLVLWFLVTEWQSEGHFNTFNEAKGFHPISPTFEWARHLWIGIFILPWALLFWRISGSFLFKDQRPTS